jgi:hypothetical protein
LQAEFEELLAQEAEESGHSDHEAAEPVPRRARVVLGRAQGTGSASKRYCETFPAVEGLRTERFAVRKERLQALVADPGLDQLWLAAYTLANRVILHGEVYHALTYNRGSLHRHAKVFDGVCRIAFFHINPFLQQAIETGKWHHQRGEGVTRGLLESVSCTIPCTAM